VYRTGGTSRVLTVDWLLDSITAYSDVANLATLTTHRYHAVHDDTSVDSTLTTIDQQHTRTLDTTVTLSP
jgi:hypothetical protein